jgi:hypothetical protein
MLVLGEDSHGGAGYIQGGVAINIQSPGSFNVNGKVLNGGIFASGYSIPAEFRPKRRIGLTGNGHHEQPDKERNTRCAGQLYLFHYPTFPEKNYSNGIFYGVVIACDKRDAFAQGSQRVAQMRARSQFATNNPVTALSIVWIVRSATAQAALLTFSTFTPPPSSSITLLRSFTSA